MFPLDFSSPIRNPNYNSWFRAQTSGVEVSAGPLNRTLSQYLHIFFAISISVIFHELGHALSAISEGASIVSVGVLCFAIFPGAFGKCFHRKII
jgi:hypothetical protein